MSIADLKGGKRNAEIVFPRQIAMYLIRNMTETSLKAVGVILGGKDHSTIKHGIEKIENELQADETLLQKTPTVIWMLYRTFTIM